MSGREADRARRHTRYFLEWARAASPVHIGADVDMTAVQAHRRASAPDRRYSVVSYLLYAGSRVLARHPEANASAAGLLTPRTVRHERVSAKLALDRRDRRDPDGGRAVLTVVIPDVDRLELAAIQDWVDRCRDGDPARLPGAERVRLLGRLPAPLGRAAFRAAVGPARRRAALLGTFAVSSLGHRAVDSFNAYGGTAVTLTAGRVAERAVARDGQVGTAPVLRLGLTFDHRVIDGAMAADILDGCVEVLEGCDVDLPGCRDGLRLPLGDRSPDPRGGPGRALGDVHVRAAEAR